MIPGIFGASSKHPVSFPCDNRRNQQGRIGMQINLSTLSAGAPATGGQRVETGVADAFRKIFAAMLLAGQPGRALPPTAQSQPRQSGEEAIPAQCETLDARDSPVREEVTPEVAEGDLPEAEAVIVSADEPVARETSALPEEVATIIALVEGNAQARMSEPGTVAFMPPPPDSIVAQPMDGEVSHQSAVAVAPPSMFTAIAPLPVHHSGETRAEAAIPAAESRSLPQIAGKPLSAPPLTAPPASELSVPSATQSQVPTRRVHDLMGSEVSTAVIRSAEVPATPAPTPDRTAAIRETPSAVGPTVHSDTLPSGKGIFATREGSPRAVVRDAGRITRAGHMPLPDFHRAATPAGMQRIPDPQPAHLSSHAVQIAGLGDAKPMGLPPAVDPVALPPQPARQASPAAETPHTDRTLPTPAAPGLPREPRTLAVGEQDRTMLDSSRFRTERQKAIPVAAQPRASFDPAIGTRVAAAPLPPAGQGSNRTDHATPNATDPALRPRSPPVGAARMPLSSDLAPPTEVSDTDAPAESASRADIPSPLATASAKPHMRQHRADPATQAADIARQIAPAIDRRADGVTEIRLDPVELGQLRMTVQATDATVTLTLQAERPETADLMRRHLDGLVTELRSLGYADVSIQLDGGRGGQGQDRGAAPVASPSALTAAPPDDPLPAAPRPRSGALDLRL